MNQHLTSAELKDLAKGHLQGKYGTCILANLVPGLCSMGVMMPIYLILTLITGISAITNKGEYNEMLLTIVIFVITVILQLFAEVFQAGSALFYLNIACGRRYSVSDMFFGFRWQFGKSLALAFVLWLINLVCLLPYDIFYFLMTYDFQWKWVIGTVISYLVGQSINIPLTLALSQSFYLLLDFPQYTAKQLLRFSIRVMKGNKGRLFYLDLSFLPLTMLAGLSGIGLLWLYPYVNMTMALFFLDLMTPQNPQSATYDATYETIDS